MYTQVAQETVKNLGVPAVSYTCANMIDDAVYHTSTGWGTGVRYALPLEAFQKSCKTIRCNLVLAHVSRSKTFRSETVLTPQDLIETSLNKIV